LAANASKARLKSCVSMHSACACASLSIISSMPIAHSWLSIVLVIVCANQGPSASMRATLCASASSVRLVHGVEPAPGQALVGPHRAPRVQQLGGAALADDARQQAAGAHVGAGQADAREQERRLRRRRAQAPVGRQRHHRAGPGAHAVDGGHHRLRRMRLMALTRSPVMRVKRSSSGAGMRVSGSMISNTSPPEQKLPPSPVITTLRTSLAWTRPRNRSRSSA
jgi:hypothetical protein